MALFVQEVVLTAALGNSIISNTKFLPLICVHTKEYSVYLSIYRYIFIIGDHGTNRNIENSKQGKRVLNSKINIFYLNTRKPLLIWFTEFNEPFTLVRNITHNTRLMMNIALTTVISLGGIDCVSVHWNSEWKWALRTLTVNSGLNVYFCVCYT